MTIAVYQALQNKDGNSMQIVRLASASFAALTVAAVLGSVSASAQSTSQAPVASDKAASATAQTTSNASTPARFATLARVKAVPMSSSELDAVKGQHIHFVTPSQNTQNFGVTGLHLVNRNNTSNWEDLYGDGPVGPGYHGLCQAALNSPKMFIPGQNPVTGHGGGC